MNILELFTIVMTTLTPSNLELETIATQTLPSIEVTGRRKKGIKINQNYELAGKKNKGVKISYNLEIN